MRDPATRLRSALFWHKKTRGTHPVDFLHTVLEKQRKKTALNTVCKNLGVELPVDLQ